MRKSIRAALFACAALSTLALASSALAAYTSPKLVVGSLTPQAAGSGGPVRVGVTVANTDDPTARVQIYIPAGYQIGTPGAGTKLGDVTAHRRRRRPRRRDPAADGRAPGRRRATRPALRSAASPRRSTGTCT